MEYHSLHPVAKQDQLEEQRKRTARAEAKLQTMKNALGDLSNLEAKYSEVLWGKDKLSGTKVFEGRMWLEKEIATATGWVVNEQRKLRNMEVRS